MIPPTEILHDPLKQFFQVGGHKITYGRPLFYVLWVVWCATAAVVPGLLAFLFGPELLLTYVITAIITIASAAWMGEDNTFPVNRDAWSLESGFKKAKEYARRIDLTNTLVTEFNTEQKEAAKLLE
jgi:hypothetical protein